MEHQVEAQCCVAAVEHQSLTAAQLNRKSQVVGLGQLVENCLHADRVVTFGSR